MRVAPSIECPACGIAVPFGTATCPQDGTPLVIDENGLGARGLPGQQPELQGHVPDVQTPPTLEVQDVVVDEEQLRGGVRTGLRDPLIGAMLGEYRVEERIGLGGMGLVYRGVHPVINKPVAIKVLRPEICDSASHVERLLEEARAVNAIRHRGIIDIFAFGKTSDGRQYLVMEFLDGVALDTHIAHRGMLAPNEAVSILEEMCAALAAAHGAGVIHRDLKPNNIFLVKQGYGQPYVKLLDFGLAKQGLPPGGTTPQTHFGLVVGTPEYMAPEQARGENVGPKTDLYALGVVAFQMLTGHLPFEANSPMEYVVKHLEHPPPVVIDEQPDVPQDLSDLVARLLAKSPEGRPGSAEEVRRMARRIARAMPQEITHVGALPVAPPPVARPEPAEPKGDPKEKDAAVRSSVPVPPTQPQPPALAVAVVSQPPSGSSRSAPTLVVTIGPAGRRALTYFALAMTMVVAGVAVGLAVKSYPRAPRTSPAVGRPPPVVEATSPAVESPPTVAEAPPTVKEPPPTVVEPQVPESSHVPPVRSPRQRDRERDTRLRPAAISRDRVLKRIDTLDRKYAASPAPSKLAAVALRNQRTVAQRARPDELQTVWDWLDRWETMYLPER